MSLADFRTDANVANAYSVYTVEPIKLWEENLNAAGNALDNVITGNRGNNTLSGGKGNDTYPFAKGDDQDTIIDSDGAPGNSDVLQFTNLSQNNLWVKHGGNHPQITINDWYAP